MEIYSWEKPVIKPCREIQWGLFFFLRKPKLGHRIMWKYFTNNCLLNASNLDWPAGLYDEKKKQTWEKWKKYLIRMELHMNPVGWNFVKAKSGGGTFRELGGKCLVTHFPVAIQSCLNEALSFHTPTLMHCQGQKVISSYVTPWQLHSPVSAMRYLCHVPVAILKNTLPSAPHF